MKLKKSLLKVTGLTLICLLIYAGWIKYRSTQYSDGGLPLAIRWEGFFHDMNHRDLGTSMNQCLNEPYFKEGLLMRSATWFSGWGCSKVGSPDVIYSLNFSPERNERYFCQQGDNKKIGRYFNFDKQLSDLEILDQWNDPQIKGATCGFIKDIFVSVLEDQKTLFHCDAGRDRTGAIAALLSAIVAESTKDLDSRMIGAIECDYQKTKSLDEEKHGRMGYFITQIIRQGGVNNFVSKNCNIDPEVIAAFSKKMRYD